MSPLTSASGRWGGGAQAPWTEADERRAAEWLRGVVSNDPPALGELSPGLEVLLRTSRLDLLAYATGACGERRPIRELVSELKIRRLAAAAARAVDVATQAGVRSVVIKGPAIGERYWGDALLRESSDVDLLVRHQDVAPVREAFGQLGYRTGDERMPGWYERRWFYHEALHLPGRDAPTVELHWDFMYGGFARNDVAALLAAGESVDVCGVTLPAPSTPWQLVTSAAHCVHHLYLPRALLDLALVGRAASEDEWSEAVAIARRAGIAALLYYAVCVSAARLGWAVPEAVVAVRPATARDCVARRYISALPWFTLPSRAVLQLHHLVSPVLTCDGAGCVTRIPGSMLTDRGNLAIGLERARRSLVRDVRAS